MEQERKEGEDILNNIRNIGNEEQQDKKEEQPIKKENKKKLKKF